MSDLLRFNREIIKRQLGIAADCNYYPWLQRDQKPYQEEPARLALLSRVTPVRPRITWFVRVQGKRVPQEDWSIKVAQCLPNDSRGPLRHHWAASRPR